LLGKNSGFCAHYLPNKLHPYAFITRVIGHSWQRKLIKILRPESIEVTGYRAFYNQCSPAEMKRLFKRVGFKNIKLIYFYRANDYFAFFMPMYIIISIFENMCRLLHLKLFCSGLIIIGEKIAE